MLPPSGFKSGEPSHGFLELGGQVAIAGDAIAFSAIERVLAGPGTQYHFWMVQEVPVDCNLTTLDGERADAEPLVINVVGWLPGSPLAEEYDVGDDCRAFAFEGIRWVCVRPRPSLTAYS